MPPADPVDRAAACSAIQAATELEPVGAAGHLSADARERVLRYSLLEGTHDGSFDDAAGNAVIRRTRPLFDETVEGDWKTLRPACASAYPAAADTTPTLPTKPADRALQGYVLIDFMRKALAQYGGRYGDAVIRSGAFNDRLDMAVAQYVRREHLGNAALKARKARALASAAALDSPPATIAACAARGG